MSRAKFPKGALLIAAIALVAIVSTTMGYLGRGGSRIAATRGEESYALEFGPEFNSFLASRDDLGISVIVAIDSSGSMSDPPKSGGRAKYIQASAALGQVADLLERLASGAPSGQVLKVGVLKFDSVVRELLPLTVMDEGGLALLRDLVLDPENFRPGGSTAIGATIECGVRSLSQSGTILRSLVIVTDGENTAGVEPAWALSAVYGNRNTASSPELPVSTGSTLITFIGFDIDSGAFKRLSAYGPRIASATDQSQLALALSASLEADITKLETPELGEPR
ncbi:MAG: VWA domain-containing protein [Spirochaetaceae bacterium]|nr:VWA domain-containing protein [Spirochaetaceae bacterium]